MPLGADDRPLRFFHAGEVNSSTLTGTNPNSRLRSGDFWRFARACHGLDGILRTAGGRLPMIISARPMGPAPEEGEPNSG